MYRNKVIVSLASISNCKMTSSLIVLSDNEIEIEIEYYFFIVFERKLALLHLSVLLSPFVVLLQSKRTTPAENGENLLSVRLE